MFSKACPILVAVLLSPLLLRAADDVDFNRDLNHTVAARRALLEDKELGPLNLGVKVHNRVATLWGPVPSKALAKRAVDVLRKLPELIEVRNDLQVEAGPDRPMFLPELPVDRRPPPLPPPLPGPPGILANHPLKNVPQPVALNDQTAWHSVQTGRKDPRIPDDREIDVVMSALPVPTPVAEPAAAKPLPQAIQELQRDRRFQQIRIEMKGDVVYLRPEAEQSQNIYELARLVARVQGVQRVVVKEN